MNSLQQIIDTGEVDPQTESEVLEAAMGLIEFQIQGLSGSHWGEMAQARIRELRNLLERIQSVLNSRRGVDGMTELTSNGLSNN